MSLQERTLDVLTMPLAAGAEVLRPEQVILSFGDGYSFDLGAFCYAKRTAPIGSRKNSSRPKSERLVDVSSFIPDRVPALRRALHHFSDFRVSGGKRPATVFALARHYGAFLEWADAQAFGDVLLSTEVLRQGFSCYIEHLRHKVATGDLAQNTAAIAQQSVLVVAMELSGLDDIHHGLNLLRIDKHARVTTEPPSEAAQGRVLALCQALFEGLADLCLDFKSYPYALTVPATVGAPGNQLWMFPSLKWCMAPHELAARDSLKQGFWAYDYANGRVAAVEEIVHRYSHNPAKGRREAPAEATIRDALQSIEAANADRQNGHRRNAALLAHNAFLVLFLAHTGMNWATVRELPWTNDHELGVERQGFRAVKYRANGRMVSFEIQSVFLPTFRKFLRLRDYLLNGTAFEHLFIASGNTGKKLEPLKAKALTNIFDSLRRLDPGLPDIKSKQWRAGKSDWLLRKTDPATTATVLQNSEATVLASYAAGSPTTHGDEMSAFFDRLQSAVLERGAVVPDGVSNAVGVCTSFGAPRPTLAASVTPDCRTPEGCFSCDKFKVHADENDTRKLLSCRYCILQTAHMVVSEEHFQVLFGPLLARIADLLQAIDQREPGMVARIEQEVAEGELDPYWGSKLEMLVDLEIIQ